MKHIPIITLIVSLLTLWFVWQMSGAMVSMNQSDAKGTFDIQLTGQTDEQIMSQYESLKKESCRRQLVGPLDCEGY